MPGLMAPNSLAITSARHSRRPWRIKRKSSVPGVSTAPTDALRAAMMPLSGASTWVCCRRSCWLSTLALAAATRATAVSSAVMYCTYCWALITPVGCRPRARSALARASLAAAWAWLRLAWAWAMSACTGAAWNTASTWPALTTSPTLTRTSVRRKPPISVPTLASCQAAILPLALICIGKVCTLGLPTVTVRAGLGGAALGVCDPAMGVKQDRPKRRAIWAARVKAACRE